MSAAPWERRDEAGVGGGEASSTIEAAARAKAETGSARSQCLDALAVAINQASDTRKWYTGTKELQLSSLELCEACRGAHTVHLRVEAYTPTTLLAVSGGPCANSEEGVSSRAPQLRARRVTWALPSVKLLSKRVDSLAEVEELCFVSSSDRRLEIPEWPSGRLRVDPSQPRDMNESIIGILWPSSLQAITFGPSFNQPIEGVTWPSSLLQLELGIDFNQRVERVTWPTSLEELRCGLKFNQPIDGVTWPPSLLRLYLGEKFNHSIEGVTWPKSLQELTFGDAFHQPIAGVAWPESLLSFKLRGFFDQPIGGVTWPTSLVHLELWNIIDQPIDGVTWPASLLKLILGVNQPIEGVTWPPLLRELALASSFNQSIVGVKWPISLKRLSLGDAFDQPIEGVAWPPSLEELSFGEYFDQPIDAQGGPSTLRRLELGAEFRHSLKNLGTVMPSLEYLDLHVWLETDQYDFLQGIHWPTKLKHLSVAEHAILEGLSIPRSVKVTCLT